MISLSQTAGRILSPNNPTVIAIRDAIFYILGFAPPVKRYFAEMRFKPMARYREGALHYGAGYSPRSSVGRMFIQPRVETLGAPPVRLDDVTGPGFAVLAWGTNPAHPLSDGARRVLDSLNAKLLSAVPMTQLAYESGRTNDVTVIGDSQGRLKDWFNQRSESVVVLRPDRIVALACRPAELDAQVLALGKTMSLRLAA
jgi:3-(3-hydroxy-phenyl)propionate hydroxylase